MIQLTRIFFFGNLFYGLCTVALSVETNIQLGISLNRFPFYLLAFLATVVYYSRIYYRTSFHISSDERSAWFRNYRPVIRVALIASCIGIVLDVLYMMVDNYPAIIELPAIIWVLIFIVPVVGLLYTFPVLTFRKLRQVGWLKPFIIGFVWAGLVTIFPFLFWLVNHPLASYTPLLNPFLFWLQNFLFISALAIVFDIKDYSTDKNLGLFTIPARIGVPGTIRKVIVPMALLSFVVLFCFHRSVNVPYTHSLLQAIPYLTLLITLRNLAVQKKLLFYLAAVDGLMFLKGLCGIISITIL